MKTFRILLLLCFALPLYGQNITLEDLFQKHTFSQKGIQQIRSIGDGEFTTLDNKKGIVLKKYTDRTFERFLLDSLVIDGKRIRISNYALDNAKNKLLLTTNVEAIYRHSFKADYYVMNIATKEIQKITKNGKIQEAVFSPNGNKIAYVRDNNLFIFDLKTEKETQLTADGELTKIINGLPDWVYEEEFGFSRAFDWSPNGNQIAYLKFDESAVPTFTFFKYDNGASYPEPYTYKYPKAGEQNATVSVWIYDLPTAQTKELEVNKNSEQYIPRIKWTKKENELLILRLNRHQNNLDYLMAETVSGNVKNVYTEKNKYYVSSDNFDAITFLNENEFGFLSELNGYNNLYRYNYNTKTLMPWVQQDWDITGFYGIDKNENAFFQAANKEAYNRTIFKANKDGKLTLLSSENAYHNANFDKDFHYWIDTYTTVTTPVIYEVKSTRGEPSYILEDNKELKEKWAALNLPVKEFIELPSAEENTMLYAWRLLPQGFDKTKKYPVLITQYSGPNSQQVKNRFGVDWYDYLAQEGFIVYCVDVRGTGARGEHFRKQTYMQLGKLESDDMIAVGRYLQSLPYVKANDISIWGWSYGGFMSSLCLMKGQGVFNTAIAIAPVTHWGFYDSVYTERYMRTPQENPDGYNNNSPLGNADKLKGDQNFLLVHGTADDNVHIQNTYTLTAKLVARNIPFNMHIYTDKNHSIYGLNTRIHLYKKFMDFLNQRNVKE